MLRPRGIIYWGIAAAIVLSGAWLFLAWQGHYRAIHPEITWATPWIYEERHTLEIALVWREEVIAAPMDGMVRYRGARFPRRVRKGEALATVATSGESVVVRAPSAGYWTRSLDGEEERWTYSYLWRECRDIPDPPAPRRVEEGRVRRGDPLGKIVVLPQELRGVVYVPATPSLLRSLREGSLLVLPWEEGQPVKATVRIALEKGLRRKVLCALPLFPVSFVPQRVHSWIIQGSPKRGVRIPQSAVTIRSGRRGVFVVTGAEAVFREVEGTSVSREDFLVTQGLSPGEIVLEDAGRGREGRIKLW